MKKCPNCGKMNLDKDIICKQCQCEIDTIAAGTFTTQEPIKTTKKEKITNHKRNLVVVLLGITLFPISWITIYIWNFFDMILNDADYYGGWIISFCALLVSVVVVCVGLLIECLKSDRKKLIDIQFDEDQTSICPQCGNHNIKVYRNGYEWSKGYWLRIFDVKGGGYLAGIDSNRARCRCRDCGNDWLTDYDYRLIK